MLVARRGDDSAILPEQVHVWGWEHRGWRQQSEGGELRWYLFSDRGLYRPGEQMRLKGWVRQAQGGKSGDLVLPAGLRQIQYTVNGPRQEEIAKGDLEPGPLAGFSTVFTLPEALNLGGAGIRLEAQGAVPQRGRETWHQIHVQEFRRPEYEVAVEADPGPYRVGDTVSATVRAGYYGGGGLPNAPVEWHVRSEPGDFTPPGWDEWQFGRAPWWGWRSGVGGRSRDLTGTTDESGTHQLKIDLLDAEPPFPVSLHATAQVGDVSRQVGSGGVTLLVHPAAIYAGLRAERGWIRPGDSLSVQLVAVDLAGKAVPGQPLELHAERVEWRHGAGPCGGTDVTTDSTAVCRVMSAAEPVRCTWRAERAGSYRLVAEVRDAAGRPSRTELPVWVSGEWTPPRPDRPDAGEVGLVADREEYQPGDTAEVLVQPPFYPAEATLTLRRSRVLRTERFRINGPTHELRIPITETHIPGVYLRVELVDAEHGTAFAWGEIQLGVPPLRRELTVHVLPRDSLLEPGAKSSIEIEVRGNDGRPVAGTEVAVWMVDEAILALGGYNLPDPLGAFYPWQPPSVRDHFLRSLLLLAPRSAGPGTVSGTVLSGETGQPAGGVRVSLLGREQAISAGPDGAFTLNGIPRGTYTLRLEGPSGAVIERRITVPAEGIHLGTLVLNSGAGGEGVLARGAPRGMQELVPPPPPPAMPPPPGETVALEALVVNGAQDFSGVGKASRAREPVALRTNFAPLALFEPALRTGANGRVRVPVRLPETLTRYRVMAVAVDGAKRFGRGEATLSARRELMLRPSAPRFLNYGDRAEIPLIVQNLTDRPLAVDVAMRGVGLQVGGTGGQRATVPARDRIELRFPATATKPGTAQLQAIVVAGARSDAAGVAIPVYTPATTEAFATYGEIDTSRPVVLPVALPGNVLPGFGGLEVTVSSTELQALTDAVLYLRTYPFECAEQIASRVLAVAALRDVLTAFRAEGLPPPDELVAATKRDIRALAGLQQPDGGWGWWASSERSDPFVSAHVAHALERARANGFSVPPGTLERATDYLRRIEPQMVERGYSPRARTAIVAYALYVRDRLGDPAATVEARRNAARIRTDVPEGVPLEAAGWLLHVLADDPAARAEAAELLRILRNRATEKAATATFVTAYEKEAEHLLLHSNGRSDAVVLDALMAADPGSDLIPKTVRGLLAGRVRGRWQSTQENAWALLALGRYFQQYEGVTPDFRSRVWLGERFAGEHAFQGRTTERHHLEIPLREVARADTAGGLTLAREGMGRMYYRAGLRYAPAALSLDPLQRGFIVERNYQPVDDPADVRRAADGTWRVRAGARVRIRVSMIAPSTRYHVALVDPLPAGFEPVNPDLRGVGFTDAPMPERGTRPAPPWWESRWYVHQNLRDERAEAFATELPAGRYEYEYLARATAPGTFVVPPPRAEEMYHPETFGRGASTRVVVESAATAPETVLQPRSPTRTFPPGRR